MATSLIPGKRKQFKPLSVARFDFSFQFSKGIIGGGLVLLLAIIAFGATTFWVYRIQGDISDVQNQREVLTVRSRTQDLSELKIFARRARAIEDVVENHNRFSQLFQELERNTHQRVTLLSFELVADKQSLELRGITSNFESLGEQFMIWRDGAGFVKSVQLNSFEKNSTGQIAFSATININESFVQ